jgi:hypothetical protein
MRTVWRGHETDYAFCWPNSMRLAYDVQKPRPLPLLVARFGQPCRRASNGGYFLGYDALAKHQGVLVAGGRHWCNVVPPGRPVLAMHKGWLPRFGDGTAVQPESVEWAISAGPMLVNGGQVTDLAALVARGQYIGFDAQKVCPQVAVGLTAEGLLIHVVMMWTPLRDLADFLLAQGCVQAIKFDGGGSTCLMEDGRVTLGEPNRRLPTALVMLDLVAAAA